ncbi:type IV pilus assembly protein PilW [gamma proteobacterium HTCC5015]|nr:type IV pilus assembly protein PilW [gamma proteobacterium HTCC5015]
MMLNRVKKSAGFTLIELLISMLIGAFLVGGIATLFVSSNQTYSSVEQLSRLQENGRFAMAVFDRYLSLAGFDNYYRADRPSGFSTPVRVVGCGGELCSSNGATSDQLSIEYDLPIDNPTAAWEFITCNGTTLNTGSPTRRVIETFSVDANPADDSYVLRCRSFDAETENALGGWADVVDGIRDFQFQLGLKPVAVGAAGATGTPSVTTYANAGQAAAVGDQDTLNERLLSVRIGMVVRAGNTTSNNMENEAVETDYQVLDGPAVSNDSGQIHYIFTETFQLNNAV